MDPFAVTVHFFVASVATAAFVTVVDADALLLSFVESKIEGSVSKLG